MIAPATDKMATNLGNAILDNNDLKTVEAGAPAYLMLMDGLLQESPESESLLRSASSLNGSFASVFVKNEARKKRLSEKSLLLAFRALCAYDPAACDIRDSEFKTFQPLITGLGSEAIPTLYTLGSAWAGWIQVHSDDWNAVAEIARVQVIMDHLLELDESYENGNVHLYLGVLASLFPPSMGGKPEKGREHFEKAIAISQERHLMVKVLFARHYARLVFDRELHDRLLNEVLQAEAAVPRLTLLNTLAQQQAQTLLDGADDYF